MNKVFIIGTGRNGSKVIAKCLSTGSNIDLYGEVGDDGPQPEWYKEIYHGIGDLGGRMARFGNIRSERFKKCKEVYLEKSHLISPVLAGILTLWPDAKFIYLKRNSKKVVRSFLKRNWYSEEDMAGVYGKGRLTPLPPLKNAFEKKWDTFKKSCWLYFEYTRLCLTFKQICPPEQFMEAKYGWLEKKDVENIRKVFDFAGIDGYNEFKVLSVLSTPQGTNSDDEPTYKDWSETNKKFFDKQKNKLKKEFPHEFK